MTVPPRLPQIFIARHEYGRLRAAALAQRGSFVARLLLSELDRAIVCPPDSLPDDVVAMNCRATYRLDGDAAPESRFLVYPEDFTLYGGQVSVLTPIGAALIGLRVGDRMLYRTPGGAENRVTVERIDFRPNAKILPFRAPRRPSAPRWDDPGPSAA